MINIENIYYVYVWYIIETNEVFYVGKGKNNRYKQVYNRNKFFKDIYNSHNCDVKIIYNNLSEKEAFKIEIETIKYYKENYPQYRLTNQTNGGEGCSGWIPHKEFREKQKIKSKERWKNEEFKNKMIKIRQDENGVYKSKEFRNKISSLVKGENNPNYNHKWTDEQKEKASRRIKDNNLYKGENNPKSKKIMCIENGEIFSYIGLALKKYNVKDETSMSVALNNKKRTCSNLHWVEINDKNIEFYNNKENRIKYLIECYISSKKYTSYINLETNKLLKNKKELREDANVSKSFNVDILLNDNKYMELKEYYSRTYQQ